MIRPFTCLAVVLAASSGLYLYSEKHRTTLLDDRIRLVVDDTHRVEDRTSMLRAEWALLNQPDRLQSLASRFLPGLQPIAPTQFVQVASLASHLPAIGAPPAAVATPVAAPTPEDGGALVASAVPPVRTPAAPVAVASIGGTSAVGASGVGPTVAAGAPLRLASAKEVIAPAPMGAADQDAAGEEAAADDAGKRVSLAPKVIPIHAVARLHKPAPRRPTLVAATRPAVRDVAAYGTAAPMLAAAWRPASPAWHPAAAPMAPAFAGSALGMAHMSIAPPMAPAQ